MGDIRVKLSPNNGEDQIGANLQRRNARFLKIIFGEIVKRWQSSPLMKHDVQSIFRNFRVKSELDSSVWPGEEWLMVCGFCEAGKAQFVLIRPCHDGMTTNNARATSMYAHLPSHSPFCFRRNSP